MNRHQIRTSLGPAYAMKSDREIDRIVVAVLEGVRELEPTAYFQFNDGWSVWEEVSRKAAGEDGAVAFISHPTIDALIAQLKNEEAAAASILTGS
jgi:hypothetical protein